MAAAFANHAAIARELVEARANQQRLAVLEDRDRIARDLHDHVIQRLFAAGLSVQSAANVTDDEQVSAKLTRVVDDVDGTIRQIRTSIFQLRATGDSAESLRLAVLDVVAQVAPMLGFDPAVRFTGPLDTLADAPMISDVVAVVREALTNVAKHAQASEAVLELAVQVGALTIEVNDNGTGWVPTSRYSGLRNLQSRAEVRGGTLRIEPQRTGGTRLTWSIPSSQP